MNIRINCDKFIVSKLRKSLSKKILRKHCFILSLLVISLCVFAATTFAQQIKPDKPKPKLTRILFIFDGSQSMYGRWQSDMKINIARKLLIEMLDSLKNAENLELALRVYGHQSPVPPQDCNDTKLEVPFAKDNISKIKDKLKSVVPKGTTPIARSLELCANDFPDCKDCRNIIILITDGIEECQGDPCAVSLALQKKGIILKPFVIGIGGSLDVSAFRCIGTVFDASNEKTFRTILNVVISQALNNTTAQVNLLDITGKPTETNVPMTFYDMFSGAIRYNFVHTLNARGIPDTLVIDPLSTYKLVVHTIPPVSKDSITLVAGKHTIIPLDAPQGQLALKVAGRSDYKNLNAIVRKTGEMKTLNVQSFTQNTKYIVGNYDLEVLCLPRLIIKEVKISQSYTTSVEIPQPGLVSINTTVPGYGGIFVEENNELTLVYNLNENVTMESLLLQPGNYRIIFRPKASWELLYSIEKTFKIESGKNITVKLY